MLVALATPAAAEHPPIMLKALPHSFQGGWCATSLTDSDGWSSSTYYRIKYSDCAGDWLMLRGRGYVENIGEPPPVTCRFLSIQQIGKQMFAVTARCQGYEEPGWHTETMQFELSGAVLTGSVKVRITP